MAVFVVTGSSRGLGLELIKSLATSPQSSVAKVFATGRGQSPKAPLADIITASHGRVSYVQLDTSDSNSISQAARTIQDDLAGKGIDVLINNAGTQVQEPGGLPDSDALSTTFATNVVGVNEVSAAFLPLLLKGLQKKIINVSSTLGSIAMAKTFAFAPVPSYKISKAALNMLTNQYALQLADEGFTVLSISPGCMRTDIGGPEADLSTEEGAKATLDIIFNASTKDNSTFRNISIEGNDNYNGEEPPW